MANAVRSQCCGACEPPAGSKPRAVVPSYRTARGSPIKTPRCTASSPDLGEECYGELKDAFHTSFAAYILDVVRGSGGRSLR
eukprot:CAMPEP_0170264202 /NCGR_PEP_ID=MMETSP0116_2-20130129/31994_1 /TAXON_ID=400756 /ORGANISM="Durinskia baltica, Strain CSIRO CS-38" /LENGTH=81 /DNA_ID=CAMNT_0010515291 /DNA_START=17 /DNA_END=258 /DNA_ORIENTATION=-